jgi:hypothetical protein
MLTKKTLHSLQFLELQLELVEEWRVRLTQLLNAAVETLLPETFLVADSSPHPLTAVINAAHHTRTILLQWAHSLVRVYLEIPYPRNFVHHIDRSIKIVYSGFILILSLLIKILGCSGLYYCTKILAIIFF